MLDETIILLSPFEDFSGHRLQKHIGYLALSVPFNAGFYQPLKQIFSKVILYDYLKRTVEIGFRAMNQEIIELVKEKRPKYALWVALGEYYEIRESTFNVIREEGAQIIGWFFDDDVRFDYYSKWWVPHIDYFVTNDIEAVPKYKELGAWATRAICTGLPVSRDWSNVKEKYDVSFVGSMRADREQYVDALKKRNIPINIFGLGTGQFVSYEEMLDIFGASKINLNFSKTYMNMKLGIKARIFEVCLAGGFLLTEYFPSVEDYFAIDKEIVCFRNAEEMADKINYYLSHDEERRAIAQAGWQRATNEYSSFHILSRVFQEVKDSGKGKIKHIALKMPMRIRKRVSQYYFNWGAAFLLENYRGLWRQVLVLSILSYPFNLKALYHYVIGFFPHPMRIRLVYLYRGFNRRLSYAFGHS